MAKQWYAVRSVIDFGLAEDGRHIYEERVCLFRAGSSAKAFEQAEREVERYVAEESDWDYHENLQMHCLGHGDEDLHGKEVFSFLTTSAEPLDAYFAERYDEQEYFPDEDDDED